MRCVAHDRCPKCAERGMDTRGDNLGIYADGSVHCFACGYHRNGSYFLRRLQEQDSGLKELKDGSKGLLPADFTRDVPAAYLKWLLQFGLPWSYWKDKIGTSPSEERLYFLIGEPLAFSTGRYLGNEKASKWFTRGDCHRHAEVVGPKDHDYVVLVEDWISANKVGQHATCIPLFGTNIHTPAVYYLMQANKPVVLWLDNDQQQYVKAKAMRLQSIINNPVNVLVTKDDPKSYSLKEIKDALGASVQTHTG